MSGQENRDILLGIAPPTEFPGLAEATTSPGGFGAGDDAGGSPATFVLKDADGFAVFSNTFDSARMDMIFVGSFCVIEDP